MVGCYASSEPQHAQAILNCRDAPRSLAEGREAG